MSDNTSAVDQKLAELQKKIAIEKKVRDAANSMLLKLTDKNAREQCESNAIESQRRLDFLEGEYRKLLSKRNQQSVTNLSSTNAQPVTSQHSLSSSSPNLLGTSGSAGAGHNISNPNSRRGTAEDIRFSTSRVVSTESLPTSVASSVFGDRQGSVDLSSSNLPIEPSDDTTNSSEHTNFDYLKYGTAITTEKVHYRLKEVLYKLHVEQRVKSGTETMLTAAKDAKLKQELEDKISEANLKIQILQRAEHKYEGLCLDTIESNDDDFDYRQRKTGRFKAKLIGATNLPARRSARDEIFAVVRIDGTTKHVSRPTKTRWDESCDIQVDKAVEVEIAIYDKNNSLMGISWFRLNELEIDIKAKNNGDNDSNILEEVWLDVEPAGQMLVKLGFVSVQRTKTQRDQVFRRNQVQKMFPKNGHKFLPQTFYQVMQCALCNEFLGRNGYQCQNCQYCIHAKCFSRVITKCITKEDISSGKDSNTGQLLKYTIPHRFDNTTNLGAAWCAHCGYILPPGKKMHRCSECNKCSHKECSPMIPQFCGLAPEMADTLVAAFEEAERKQQMKEMEEAEKLRRIPSDSELQKAGSPLNQRAGSQPLLSVSQNITQKATSSPDISINQNQQQPPSVAPQQPQEAQSEQPQLQQVVNSQHALHAQHAHHPSLGIQPEGGNVQGRASDPQTFDFMERQYPANAVGISPTNRSDSGVRSSHGSRGSHGSVGQATPLQGTSRVPSAHNLAQQQHIQQQHIQQQQLQQQQLQYQQQQQLQQLRQQQIHQQQLQQQQIHQQQLHQQQLQQQQLQQQQLQQQQLQQQQLQQQQLQQQQLQQVPNGFVPQVQIPPPQYPQKQQGRQSVASQQGRVSTTSQRSINLPKARVSLKDFQFIAVLGRGAFGKVMLAAEKSTNQLYAIKALKKEFIVQNDDVKSTKLEKRIFQSANGAKHPFLVNLHSAFQTDSRVYFAMEYVSGGDLMAHIMEKKRFSQARAKFYACEVLLALEYFHKNNIIYRDLKLDNILLTPDGHIKVADYGICKENMPYGQTTRTFCGTPDYMAPEILSSNRYGRAVDWWSFGVFIYVMLVGRYPFHGEDEQDVLEAIMADAIEYPQSLGKEVLSLLRGLLNKNPAKRLGGGRLDADEVKRHPYFAGVDWQLVLDRRITAPWVPTIRHATDVSNFDPEFIREKPVLTPITSAISSQDQEEFRDFSYVSDWAMQMRAHAQMRSSVSGA